MTATLAYTTIAIICFRLFEKGLLQQCKEESGYQDRPAYVYAPLTSEADFVRDAVTQQLDGLLAHYPDFVTQYLQRAEQAECQAAVWQAEARRAQQREQSALARLGQAEARAMEWEANAHRATAQALAAEDDASVVIRRVALQEYDAARSAPEHYDPVGICRVCNTLVPDVPARRRDGLRVCAGESCQHEACRRDHARPNSANCARRRREREQAQRGG